MQMLICMYNTDVHLYVQYRCQTILQNGLYAQKTDVSLSAVFLAVYYCFHCTLPSALIISLTPWKNPLNFGFAEVWSLINFTLRVSIGVTANMASATPAPVEKKINHLECIVSDNIPIHNDINCKLIYKTYSPVVKSTLFLGTDHRLHQFLC